MHKFKFRDLSSGSSDLGAGFQFEFYCERCGETWASPFRPYRAGQLSGWLQRLGMFSSNLWTASRASSSIADARSRGAREAAYRDAVAEAERRFHYCGRCDKQVCDNCWDARAGACTACAAPAAATAASGAAREIACPNCQAPTQGGRFCAECGFDLASTHKSCPSCGVTVPRQSRFCPDCGHGF